MFVMKMTIPLCTTERLFPVDGCAGAVAGATTGGFIGGVLLTAVIAGVIALVVLCRAKRRGTTKHELVLAQSQSSSYFIICKP